MSHKGHPVCEYTSKDKCEKARRIAIGQCVSMLDEDRQCPHWGVDTVDGRGYCGQHINSIYAAAVNAAIAQTKRDRLDRLLNDYFASHGAQPHVCGARCEFSSIPAGGIATSA